MADTLYVCAQGLLPERLILVGHHRRRRFDSPGAKHSPPEKMENFFDSSVSEKHLFRTFHDTRKYHFCFSFDLSYAIKNWIPTTGLDGFDTLEFFRFEKKYYIFKNCTSGKHPEASDSKPIKSCIFGRSAARFWRKWHPYVSFLPGGFTAGV